jgi:uncharacterized damage-inducible protein DinB
MNDIAQIREWYAFNSEVRKKYLKALCALPRRDLLKDRRASFPSLLDIYVHTLDAYNWYMFYAYHDRAAEFKRQAGAIKTIAQARQYEREVDQKVTAFLKRLDSRLLASTFQFTYPPGHPRGAGLRKVRTRDMVLALIAEDLQHRGELAGLLWQFDAEVPFTSFTDWSEGRRKKRG